MTPVRLEPADPRSGVNFLPIPSSMAMLSFVKARARLRMCTSNCS